MWPADDQLGKFRRQQANLPAGAHPLNARGPLLNEAMNRFAAKLALALHFEMTGTIASSAAVVAAPAGTPTIKSTLRVYRTYCWKQSAIQALSFKASGVLETNSSMHPRAPRTESKVDSWRASARRRYGLRRARPPKVEGFPAVRPGFLRSNS